MSNRRVSEKASAKNTGKTQWVRGQSGNPKGRPAGVPNKANAELKAIAQEYTQESVDTLVSIMRNGETPPPARVAAAREILDRGHGKAPQAITGEDGGPLIPAAVIHQHVAAEALKS